jgi:hypothetical protein
MKSLFQNKRNTGWSGVKDGGSNSMSEGQRSLESKPE